MSKFAKAMGLTAVIATIIAQVATVLKGPVPPTDDGPTNSK